MPESLLLIKFFLIIIALSCGEEIFSFLFKEELREALEMNIYSRSIVAYRFCELLIKLAGFIVKAGTCYLMYSFVYNTIQSFLNFCM